MKTKIIVLLGLCFAATLLSGAVPLVKGGKAAGKIYLSKNASEGEKTAAKELQEYLKKSSGAVFETTDDLKQAGIVLGTVKSKEIPSAMKKALAGKKEEGFLFRTQNGKFYIIGASQVGTLYGAYTFLDRYLDVRWFLPGEEYVGKKKDITSLPYTKIQAFSVESSGVFDIDSELELWISGLGKIRLEFSGGTDVYEVAKLIGSFVL